MKNKRFINRGLQEPFQACAQDWHDWDVSNPPARIQTMGGKKLLSVAPKTDTFMASIAPPTACSTACR